MLQQCAKLLESAFSRATLLKLSSQFANQLGGMGLVFAIRGAGGRIGWRVS